MIPEAIHRYFWDVDPASLDLVDNQRFIIERILEKGNVDAVQWMKQQYPEQALRDVVATGRQLSPKSRHYWELTLHTWSTLNQSANKPGKIWQR